MLGLPVVALLLCAAAVLAGALVQGAVGFGMALVASPVLVLVEPALVPVSMLVVSGTLPWGSLAQEWRHVDWRGLRWALLGRLLGTGLGVALVAVLDARGIAVVVAVVVLGAIAATATGLHLPKTRAVLVAAGGIGGVTGTSTAIGGPPLAVVLQHDEGPTVRATLAAFFAVGQVLSLGALAVGGFVTERLLLLGCLLLPGCFAGLALARWVRPHVDAGRTRPAVLVVAGLSAAVLLVRSFL